jgi:hypothetical protein
VKPHRRVWEFSECLTGILSFIFVLFVCFYRGILISTSTPVPLLGFSLLLCLMLTRSLPLGFTLLLSPSLAQATITQRHRDYYPKAQGEREREYGRGGRDSYPKAQGGRV